MKNQTHPSDLVNYYILGTQNGQHMSYVLLPV